MNHETVSLNCWLSGFVPLETRKCDEANRKYPKTKMLLSLKQRNGNVLHTKQAISNAIQSLWSSLSPLNGPSCQGLISVTGLLIGLCTSLQVCGLW